MRKFTFLTVLLLTVSFYIFGQKGFINPAANYCNYMGYEYEITIDDEGNQVGVVILPDGSSVNAWDFYKGKVGNEYSYGARHGFDVETEVAEYDGYVTEYAVCVMYDKGEEIRIPMLELMEMNGEPLIQYEKQESITVHEDAKIDPDFTSAKSLPAFFDWRNVDGKAYIGPIRNQGGCGSCYAFGAAAAAEGTYNYSTNSYDGNCADFSESYIAWCLGSMPAYSSHFGGCAGADYDYQELQALVDIGICDESYFPYSDDNNQSCAQAAQNAPKTQFESWYRVPCVDIDAIKTAIMTYGVVDAAVYVSNRFQRYSGGIFSDNYKTCGSNPCYNTPTNHAISLVGWGNDPSKGDYWILRNSWGSSWGEGGYMKLAVTSSRIACSVCYMVKESGPDVIPPTIPTNLSSLNLTQISFDLSWDASTDNVGVTGYDVYKDGAYEGTTAGLTYSITGLTKSTTYAMTVKAKDAAGNISDASNPFDVTTLTDPDTEPPTVPTNLTSSNITYNSVDLSWNASTDNIGVTGYDVYKDGAYEGTTSNTYYSVTGLSQLTTYTFTVKAKDAAGNISEASNAIDITTEEEGITTYCTLYGNSIRFEWIDFVELNTISNSTGGDDGYGDYTYLSTTVTRGGSHTINLSAGFANRVYTEYWKIWIDFNQDGDFEDAGELLISGTTPDGAVYYATLNIPSDATLGETRMRVAMSDKDGYSSCGSFKYGEVEDYTVSIVNTTAFFANANTIGTNELGSNIVEVGLIVYPNPANSYINISYNGDESTNLIIYNTNGAVIKNLILDQKFKELNISDFPAGIYVITVNNEKGIITKRFVKQ